MSTIKPEDDEELDPVTDLSIFFLFKYLSRPKNPKTIASLKIINFLFGTIKFVSSLLKQFILSNKCSFKAPPPSIYMFVR